MASETDSAELVDRLISLLSRVHLSDADENVAQQCARRLSQPLRLILLGSDSQHAVSLLGFLVGLDLRCPTVDRLRVQCVFSSEPFASVEYSDGTTRTMGGNRISDAFSEDPVRVKIGFDSAVLRKLSFMIAVDRDEQQLSAEIEQTLVASDIALFCGDALSAPMRALIGRLPDRLKHHSYLTLPPAKPLAEWQEVADDFAGTVQIDPRAAQAAKSAVGGVDKEAFRQAGGTAMVRAVKRELDVLQQAAVDAAQVLLTRHAEEAGNIVSTANSSVPRAEPLSERQTASADPGAERAPVVVKKATRRDVRLEVEESGKAEALPTELSMSQAAKPEDAKRKVVPKKVRSSLATSRMRPFS